MLITIHPRWRRCAWPALALVAASLTLAASADSPQAAFIAENDAAMTKMMAGMGVKPTGDIDRDFAAMMIPHHQGAIDMALAELRYGSNEQLRRIAQEIVVEQQQEIAAMHMALGQPLPASAAVPTQVNAVPPPSASNHSHMHMHMHMQMRHTSD